MAVWAERGGERLSVVVYLVPQQWHCSPRPREPQLLISAIHWQSAHIRPPVTSLTPAVVSLHSPEIPCVSLYPPLPVNPAGVAAVVTVTMTSDISCLVLPLHFIIQSRAGGHTSALILTQMKHIIDIEYWPNSGSSLKSSQVFFYLTKICSKSTVLISM